MKWMIASDIHGSAYYCEKLLERYCEEKAERLVLLGDLLYHGPRNALPEGYEPQKTAALLNGMKDCLLCVRGNCEAEVDQMVLNFPVMADYAVIPVGKRLIYCTHGHHANEANPLPMAKGDYLLCGHTHIPCCNEHEAFTYLNPGSVSIPKNSSRHSYMVLEDGMLYWKDVMNGETYQKAEIL